jgi:hypothetical protein
MLIESMLKCCSTGSRTARALLSAACVVALSLPLAAQAQTSIAPGEPNPGTPQVKCGPDVKAKIAEALAGVKDASDADQLSTEADIYAKYEGCAEDAKVLPIPGFYVAARQCGAGVSYVGSLFFEEMPCCGYDPQRRTFACPVKIKQVFGFGPAPLPGSREHVLHCVADAAGVFHPVGQDSVHLADALAGQQPTWQFAVTANAIWNLDKVYPMSGVTRTARSILSWGLRPTGCEYRPIWGNVLNYHIRLDQ